MLDSLLDGEIAPSIVLAGVSCFALEVANANNWVGFRSVVGSIGSRWIVKWRTLGGVLKVRQVGHFGLFRFFEISPNAAVGGRQQLELRT